MNTRAWSKKTVTNRALRTGLVSRRSTWETRIPGTLIKVDDWTRGGEKQTDRERDDYRLHDWILMIKSSGKDSRCLTQEEEGHCFGHLPQSHAAEETHVIPFQVSFLWVGLFPRNKLLDMLVTHKVCRWKTERNHTGIISYVMRTKIWCIRLWLTFQLHWKLMRERGRKSMPLEERV